VTQFPSTSSTRPYMVRAMYDWCVDNQLTPFIVVAVDASVRVPVEFVREGEIVLNISMGATSNLVLGNDYIDFKARFGGIAREISVPLARVSAIYARENGQGMTFPLEAVVASTDTAAPAQSPDSVLTSPASSGAPALGLVSAESSPTDPQTTPKGPRPSLTRVK
jgi:stringent starvation protein B